MAWQGFYSKKRQNDNPFDRMITLYLPFLLFRLCFRHDKNRKQQVGEKQKQEEELTFIPASVQRQEKGGARDSIIKPILEPGSITDRKTRTLKNE